MNRVVRCPVDECEWTVELGNAGQCTQRNLDHELIDHSMHHSPMEYLRTIQRLTHRIAHCGSEQRVSASDLLGVMPDASGLDESRNRP